MPRYTAPMTDRSLIARQAILEAMLPLAAFDGWTTKSLRDAVANTDLPKGSDALYFPDGPLEVIGFWAQQMDGVARDEIAKLNQETMKIRDKVTSGVWAHLKAIGPHDEAARRALARLSLPDALGQGPQQLWASADMIWRAIGDTSTDANYYSKRAILSGVIASTLAVWISDNSDDKIKSREFLDARIANVMQFEKAKWDMKSRTKNWPNPAELLGALRYGGTGKRHRRRRRG